MTENLKKVLQTCFYQKDILRDPSYGTHGSNEIYFRERLLRNELVIQFTNLDVSSILFICIGVARMADVVSALPFTTEFQVKPVDGSYSWMGDHLGIASC